MTVKFTVDEIDNLILDIEWLDLPLEKNNPVLMLVLGAIEDFAEGLKREKFDQMVDTFKKPLPVVKIDWGLADNNPDHNDREDPLPTFLKAQAARESVGKILEDDHAAEVTADIRAALATHGPQASRAATPPQEDFSPAPLPEAVASKAPEPPKAALKTGPWSREEEGHVLAQRAKGVPFADIAAQLNRPVAAVNAKYSNLMKTGVAKPKPAPKTVPKPKKGPFAKGPYSPEDEAYLVSARAKGVPFKDIAEHLNRPEKSVTQKFYNMRNAMNKSGPPAVPIRKIEVAPAPAPAPAALNPSTETASKAEGGAGILPRPCPDAHWSIEDDFDLVSLHHSGTSMLDVSINLERTKADCIKRYTALMDAMPAGPFTERQIKLKQTLAYWAEQARAAA